MRIDRHLEVLVGKADVGDDVAGTFDDPDDRESLGLELGFDEGDDVLVPGGEVGFAPVPSGEAAKPFGEDDAIAGEAFSDDEGAAARRSGKIQDS